MLSRPITHSCIVLSLAAPAVAGVVTGRVVLGNQPVAGANLDFDPVSGGGGVTEVNDGTDAQGYFTTTVTPNNLYDMSIVPPAGTRALITTVPNVVVGAVVNDLGTIQLTPGVLLSGRCIEAATGLGLAGVDIDVLDASGSDIDLTGDFTDGLGYFTLAVPLGAIEVRFDASSVAGAMVASRRLSLDLAADMALGNLTFEPGFVLSAVLKRLDSGAAVEGADLDVIDVATQLELYTPGDDSNASGLVDVIVPAGTFSLRFAAPFAQHLVALELPRQSLSATTSLGTLFLQSGVVLSGTVTDLGGAPIAGVDVDVADMPSGLEVALTGDQTNASGVYQVIVPTGTFEVDFSPPFALPYASAEYANVVVSGSTVRNGVLPSCVFAAGVGTGIAGLGGFVPQIATVGGTPRLGNADFGFHITQARGFAKAVVVYSTNPMPNPLPAPCATLAPMNRRIFQLGGAPGVAGAGSGTYAFPLANDPLLAGHLLRAWVWVRDNAAMNGLSRTHEVRATICP